MFLRELHDFIGTPLSLKRRKDITPAPPQKTTDESEATKQKDDNPVISSAPAVLLTYNTNFGQHDPNVMGWILSGHDDDVLFNKMLEYEPYFDLFETFWHGIKEKAQSLGFGEVAVCMEWSRKADFKARVHLHAFLAPKCHGGKWEHKVPLIDVRRRDFEITGHCPDIRKAMTKQRHRTTVMGCGIYYVVGPKSGNMFHRSTVLPFQEPTFLNSKSRV